MVSEAIYRHEYKYYINDCDCEMLSRRLGVVMKRDPHTGPDGTYLIRSLYFDNYNDRALLEKINGDNPRSKFRIRIYNGKRLSGTISLKSYPHALQKKSTIKS